MKKLIVLLISLISISCYAAPNDFPLLNNKTIITANCEKALPISNPAFCSSFKSVAYCHCAVEHGMPPTACNDMKRIYQIMVATYGSLWNACSPKVQKDVSQQECYDDWTFYNSHCK